MSCLLKVPQSKQDDLREAPHMTPMSASYNVPDIQPSHSSIRGPL